MLLTTQTNLRTALSSSFPNGRWLARRRTALVAALGIWCGSLYAQNGFPAEVDAALQRAKVPRDAISLLVVDAEGKVPPRLSHRANVPVNPASIMKLVTTYAALDLLGPAFTWNTPVYIEGAVREGTLYGNLYIKGQGDPKLVLERMWLLLRRLQGLGVKTIAGDIVLDRSAFETVEQDPANFDGEPLRPYNVAPDALMINFKSVVMTFSPDRTTNLAQVSFDPPLAGVQMQTTVPLSTGDCADYRGTLKAEFADPKQIRAAARCSRSRTPAHSGVSGGVSTQISRTPWSSKSRSTAKSCCAVLAASSGMRRRNTAEEGERSTTRA
jgi:D-alanyl-D-alanine carboxypeptidase/D-alanyl-D-alanine-endopeptidase (penicillin-binding protein 4)